MSGERQSERPTGGRRERSRVAALILFGLGAAPTFFAAAGPVRSQGLTRAPVELRTPFVRAPPETAGSGIVPEALVRLTLDETGRVVAVEVQALTPSSEHDERFVAAIRETMLQWRYAPELVDGQAVGSAVEVTLQIAAAGGGGARDPGAVATEVDPEARRAAYLKLDEETRRRLLKETADQMMGYFESPPVSHATRRFVVYTDAEAETAASIGNNLETVYGVLARMFADHLQLQGEPLKLLAFIYSRQSSYRQMRSISPVFEWSVGYYHPLGTLGFHLESPRPDAVVGTLVHEATHAFMDRHVVAPGKRLPRWLSEGFAQYVGNSKIDRGKLVLGEMRKRRAYIVADPITVAGTTVDRTAAALDVVDLKRAIRDGRGLPLRRVLAGDQGLFLGDELQLFYSTSWLLVHYLVHGEAGWRDEQFPTFVTYVAEGLPVMESFERAYGLKLEGLDERLREYVLRF